MPAHKQLYYMTARWNFRTAATQDHWVAQHAWRRSLIDQNGSLKSFSICDITFALE